MPWHRKLIHFFGSLKLAVFVISAIALLTSIGTIVEARYDAFAAAQWVYKTWWMYGVMVLFILNLTVSMFQRWPWQKRHLAFVLAHIGIIVILIGSLLTLKFGIDGTMRIAIGEKSRLISVPETDLVVYASFDGDNYKKLIDQNVDFFNDSPKKKPLKVNIMDGELAVIDYSPYSISSRKVIPSEAPKVGAALRFQLQNNMTQMSEWIVQRREGDAADISMGPARIIVGSIPAQSTKQNEIYLEPKPEAPGKLRYVLYSKDDKYPAQKGELEEGQSFVTPWMGFEFRVLRWLPKAEETFEYKLLEKPTPLTSPAIKVLFKGKEQWVQQGSMTKFFTESAVYLVLYKNRDIDLGFPIELLKFEIARYQGTMRAAAYSSLVKVPDQGQIVISMNEPLKHSGFTFYQASFQEDPTTGQPIASVLSVNRDPGRALKYLGSLILCFGVVYLFWTKRNKVKS